MTELLESVARRKCFQALRTAGKQMCRGHTKPASIRMVHENGRLDPRPRNIRQSVVRFWSDISFSRSLLVVSVRPGGRVEWY